jgi:hypothetical protein
MSMTLLVAAVSPAQFEQLRADPQLLEWLHERSILDWSTTLRGFILKPEDYEARDLARMEQVDAFALSREDFCFINYLAVSRLQNPAFDLQEQNRVILEAFARAQAGDSSALQALQRRAEDFLALVSPKDTAATEAETDAASPSDDEDLSEDEIDDGSPSDQMFAPEGELDYDAGYGNCMFWSPDHFANVVSQDDAWLKTKDGEPDVKAFIERALAKRSYLVGIVY